MKALVTRSTGSFATVKAEDGRFLECTVRGIFRLKGLRTTNPVAVGDRVTIEQGNADEQYVITEIDPRENYLIRKSINLSKEAHVLAANIDKAFIIATLHSPRTSYGFIDRLLVTCEAYEIEAEIVVNKTDIYEDEDLDKLAELTDIYSAAGYKILYISAAELLNLDELKAEMQGGINLFAGHSGTGKSTLINALNPGLKLRTGDISEVHHKGKHTTTFAELFELWENTWIIDTPGVKEFGIIDMKKEEIGNYFPEIKALASGCRFTDCLHQEEPGCAVKKAFEDGTLNPFRYDSYTGLLNSEELSGEPWR